MSSATLLADPRVVSLRNRVRHNALLRGVYRLWVGRNDYEERFARALLAAVAPGDVVWDVGANVGHYTERFLTRAAHRVVCFEPAPEAIARLRERFANGPGERVRILPIALTDTPGRVLFAADGAAPTNSIAGEGAAGVIEVAALTADQARIDHGLPVPQIVKIDVEGYELEVIRGMRGLLGERAVRAVFIEMHFALLHARGLDAAPAAITRLLAGHGFTLDWLDPSHLRARRAD